VQCVEKRDIEDMGFSIISGGIVCNRCSPIVKDSVYFDKKHVSSHEELNVYASGSA